MDNKFKSFTVWAESNYPYGSAIFPDLREAFNVGYDQGAEDKRHEFKGVPIWGITSTEKITALEEKLRVAIQALQDIGYCKGKKCETECNEIAAKQALELLNEKKEGVNG